MKKLLLLTLILTAFRVSQAQFVGTLIYDCTVKAKVLTTIYETKDKARIESKIYPMKEGAADIAKGKEQDAVLLDFKTGKEMRFPPKHHVYAETEFNVLSEEKKMKLTETDISVENVGKEQIGKLNCQHFVVKIKGEKKDLWITKDLGTSNICVAGQLLYYPAGSLVLNKLRSAGGEGVVVKSQDGDQVTNLTNYQTRTPAAYNFEIPAGFTKM